MASIFDVANFYVELANNSEDDVMTNLKVNKLLYFAQGCHLARTGRPLFNENIEAWQYGPVVPEIYRKYKVCGREPIAEVDDEYRPDVFTEEELETLLDVMQEFGRYTGEALISMTHEDGTPWSSTYATVGANGIISQSLLRDYFAANPVPTFQADIPTVDRLPREWYDPEEDAEWEAYL